MKKICVILTALFGSMALSATAAPLTENKAALPQQCTMELATQQKSCDVGLARLNSMKSYTEGTN
ncbi:MAG: hypothetical protein E6004_04540 [Haemophilus parainfluenzae]|nr:hypothetical protein [Haemophilus parainfluenzae]